MEVAGAGHLSLFSHLYLGAGHEQLKIFQGVNCSNNVAIFSLFILLKTFTFLNSYVPGDPQTIKMGEHLTKHGDGVKDVSFSVEDLDAIVDRAKKKGVKIVRDIFEEQDEFGKVRYAIVQTYGETTHTFIERNNYKGLFLPGYKPARMKGEFCKGVIP